MPFNFGGPEFPTALKFARSLLISEAIIFLFVLAFAAITPLLSAGQAGSGATTSSSVSPVVLVVALLAGLLLIYLAVDLRNFRPMTRNIIVATQVLIFADTLIQSLSAPVTLGLVTLLVAGVLYCVLVDKQAQAAFAGASAERSNSSTTDKEKAEDDAVADILKKAAARDAAQKAANADEAATETEKA